MTWCASSFTRTASRRGARFAAGIALLALVAGCGSSAAAPTTPATPPGEPVKVAKVIDGDTLALADGRRVRVLGIDSCDASTVGGQKARIRAAKQLANPGSQPITLVREPGVDLDPTGMLLRYVQLNGADYGQRMIPYDHTGVSAGPPRLSAGPGYLAVVRALDTRSSDEDPPVARDCGGKAERSAGATSSSSSSRTTTSSPSEDSDDSSSSAASDETDGSGTNANRRSDDTAGG